MAATFPTGMCLAILVEYHLGNILWSLTEIGPEVKEELSFKANCWCHMTDIDQSQQLTMSSLGELKRA